MNVFLAVNGRMQAASFFLKCAIRIHPDTHGEIHNLVDKWKKVPSAYVLKTINSKNTYSSYWSLSIYYTTD